MCSPWGEAVWPARRSGDLRPMSDILFLAGGLAFFALSAGYAALCDRL
ncbi:hypothetical protein [Methylobacterium marchantiae]|uniref:Uncharacterized protein n=1 Tax=Methylobacterium marchantiae TaxID=600331 RepID=A0ABW3X0S0_9HYPH